MKITPLELRQFEFEKTFRGYSIEEVDMFINNLAQEWERVLTETKMMRMQLELAEKEAAKLREIELTLFKTLKTAEDTSTMITEQANQQAAKNLSEANVKAEKQVSEAQMQADKYLAEAKIEAEKILSDARLAANETMQQADEKAKYVKEDVLSDVKAIENDFNSLVNYKEQLLAQMRGFATATVEHVERFESKFDINAIESKILKANELVAVTGDVEEVNESSSISVISPTIDGIELSSEETPSEVHEDEVEEEKVALTEVDELKEVTEGIEEKVEEAEQETEGVTDEIDESELVEENYEDDPSENINEEVLEEIEDVVEGTSEEVTENESESIIESVIETDEELAENYDDIEETVEEITDEVIEEQEPDFSVVSSIKEKISESVAEETTAPEFTSVIPSSINKLASTEEETEFTSAAGDDLTRIEGIGPKVQDVLKDAGIVTFRDVATTPLYKLKEHLENAGPHFNMVDASTWTEQALLAAEGRWDELEIRQEELIGGKEVKKEKEVTAITETPTSPAVETTIKEVKDEVVETTDSADNVVENNLENITEEMLEKVNKVKSAIRKAMSDKSEKPDIEKEKGSLPTLDDVLKRNRNKGSGSFFDNID